MTFTGRKNNGVRRVTIREAIPDLSLIVHGQGILSFTHTDTNKPCVIYFYDKDCVNGVKVEFTHKNVLVFQLPGLFPLIDTRNHGGLSENPDATYWLSLDSQNQTLYAGIGEARIETYIYTYKFSKEFLEKNKAFLESIVYIRIKDKATQPLRLIRDPITRSVPLLIKNTDELTMSDIAGGTIMPSANLSTMGQKLYRCISGRRFLLDDREFPEFSKAIEYSIATPGCWCNTTLKKKATEFNKDKPNLAETYLRITLGQNNGESPGIPYVMEIWPAGHYSPVHNHGGSDAVIRVLHGSIQVSLFPYLAASEPPFAITNFKEGDITWISPTLNQIHQLKNVEKKACVTIQCYMYENEDTTHYDYFDYIDDAGKIDPYEPDSDMDFLEFKALMREEWFQRPQKWF
jgi:mannose-6-phosphate isomerase-like protein (cupin superfamily)